jgi:predicted O-methyltransferase YrrM
LSIQTLNLTPELYQYLLSISLREAEILQKIRMDSSSHPLANMQISPEQAQFMAFLLKLISARKVLEIGVFLGYSSTAMALALPEDGQIIACDHSTEFTDIARSYWREAGVENKIELRLAPALETLDQLISEGKTHSFDFVFIDADKSNYNNYYEKALKLVRPGGLIAVDNVLWYGRVVDETVKDNRTKKIRDFNQKLAKDDRIDLSVIPIGDGLTLARKI